MSQYEVVISRKEYTDVIVETGRTEIIIEPVRGPQGEQGVPGDPIETEHLTVPCITPGEVWTDVNAMTPPVYVALNDLLVVHHCGVAYIYGGPADVTLGDGGDYVTVQNDFTVTGVADHDLLRNREFSNQHPMEAITGLIADQDRQDTDIQQNTDDLTAHENDLANPHQVTYDQLGGTQPAPVNHATRHHQGGADALNHDAIAGSGSKTHAEIDAHLVDTNDPHQSMAQHEAKGDPHPQYLTPGELPTVIVAWLTDDLHPDDNTKYTTNLVEPTDPESSISGLATTEGVPDLYGTWLRQQPINITFEWHETEAKLQVDVEKAQATPANMYYETWLVQGGVGGTEVLLSTSDQIVLEQGRRTYTMDSSIAGPIQVTAGDTVITRIYVVKTAGGVDPTITLYMEGNNISRFVTWTPIPTYPAPHADTHYAGGADPIDHDQLLMPTTNPHEKMNWRDEWTSIQYYKHDTVHDLGYAMVANKDTTDRAAPQPIGSPVYAYNGASPTTQQTAKQILTGMRVTAQNDGYLNAYRFWGVIGNQYSVSLVMDPEGVGEITQLLSITSAVGGWSEFSIQPELVPAGTTFDVVVVMAEPDPAPTTWTGDWNYDKPQNPAVPVAGEIVHSGRDSHIMSISKTDDNAGDRGAELLALTAGDQIEFGTTSWSIQSSTDLGTYVDFVVAPALQDVVSGLVTASFHTVTSTPITYLKDINYWVTVGFTHVKGFEVIDGSYADKVLDDNAYGIDIKYQEAYISPDWDLLSAPGASGGGTGGDNLPDAPVDGSFYGRKDALWVNPVVADISDAGTLATEDDAPVDGNVYGRKDAAWQAFTEVTQAVSAIHAELSIDNEVPVGATGGPLAFDNQVSITGTDLSLNLGTGVANILSNGWYDASVFVDINTAGVGANFYAMLNHYDSGDLLKRQYLGSRGHISSDSIAGSVIGLKIYCEVGDYLQISTRHNSGSIEFSRALYSYFMVAKLSGTKGDPGDVPEAPNDGQPYVRQSLAWADGTAIFAALAHNHDGVYAPVSHQHVEADITNLDKYTQAEVDALVAESQNARYGMFGLGGDGTLSRANYPRMPGFSTLWSATPFTVTVPTASAGGFIPGDSITFTHYYGAAVTYTFDTSALVVVVLPPGKQATLSEIGKSVTITWVAEDELILTGDWDDA